MKNKETKIDMNKRLCHLPNPMHLSACLEGAKVYKNKKKYDRKVKHKKMCSEF